MSKFLHKLGLKAKDKITGFEGIITGRCEHIYGCNTYGLTPQVLFEGKRIEPDWFDKGRLEIVKDKGIEPKKVQVKNPGCEYRDHPKGH